MMWIFKKTYSVIVLNFSSKIFNKFPKGFSKTVGKIKKFLETFIPSQWHCKEAQNGKQ